MKRTNLSWMAGLLLLLTVGSAPAVRADDGARRVGLQLTLGSATGAAVGVATFAATMGLVIATGPKNDAGRAVLGFVAAIPVSIITYSAGTAAGVHWGGNLAGESGEFRKAWLGTLPGMLAGAALTFALFAITDIGSGPCESGCNERKHRRNQRIRYATGAALSVVGTLVMTSALSTAFYQQSL